MSTVHFGDVYRKIEQISRSNFSTDTPIHISRVMSSMQIDLPTAEDCLAALQILELIEFVDPDKEVFILK